MQKLKRGVRYFVEADSVAEIKKQVHRTMYLSNVLAVLPGKKTDEMVVVGAHLDHEGVYNDIEATKFTTVPTTMRRVWLPCCRL